MIAQLAARMGKSLRPREGWLPFLLLLSALLSLPAAMISGTRDPAPSLPILAAISAIVGLRLARPRVTARVAVLAAAFSGVLVSALVVGRLLPPLPILWTDATQATSRLAAWFQGADQSQAPFSQSAGYIWQQANLLALRLWSWLQRAGTGAQAQDTIVLELFSAFLVWTLGLYAVWQLHRHRAPLRGLVPGGTVLAVVSFFRGGTSFFYLASYLFCTLWLMGIGHYWIRHDLWEQAGTDYPGGLGLDLALALAPLLVPLLLIASFFPVLYPRSIRQAIWEMLDAPWSRVEHSAERLFGPIEGPGRASGSDSAGELPSTHLLGGRPELSEQRVLFVATNDPPPPTSDWGESLPALPPRYWRSRTFDTYTGHGWTNSPLEAVSLQPDQSLEPALPEGPGLVQRIQRLKPDTTLVFAANSPLSVDRSVQVWWRGPGDLAQITGQSDFYTVLSLPREPTIDELQDRGAADAELPAHIADLYLSLPDGLPSRVLNLAQKVIGSADTRYDRAHAIEQFLRSYPYNLEVPEPPSNRDLVDYFLFELQQGYCDYYASAMVVMARAVGVPARLASGYAQGTYDTEAAHWVVTEENGHSWVEVYFEGLGWVEFEPTAGVAALVRPGSSELPADHLLPIPKPSASWWQAIPWGLVSVTALIVGLLAMIVWLWRPRPTLSAADLIADRHARLLAWGTRLWRPLRDGQTVHEYAQDLSTGVHGRGRHASLPSARRAAQEAPPEIGQLAHSYTRALYSPHPVSDREGWQTRALWSRLRRRLWWLWIGSRAADGLGQNKQGEPEDQR